MRFEKGNRAATRQHILDVASEQFRKAGISAAGLASIMGEAGLTNGAFYPHFKSKADLVREALKNALGEQQQRVETNLEHGCKLEDVIRSYLSRDHLKAPDCGCPSAALLAEIGRQATKIRQTYKDGMGSYLSVLTRLIPDRQRPGRASTRDFDCHAHGWNAPIRASRRKSRYGGTDTGRGGEAALLLARA